MALVGLELRYASNLEDLDRGSQACLRVPPLHTAIRDADDRLHRIERGLFGEIERVLGRAHDRPSLAPIAYELVGANQPICK